MVKKLNNAILFANSFFSYLLLMAIIVVIAAIAIIIGIKMRKRKDQLLALEAVEADAEKQPR